MGLLDGYGTNKSEENQNGKDSQEDVHVPSARPAAHSALHATPTRTIIHARAVTPLDSFVTTDVQPA